MPRLRNEATGVVVEVSDETAALLGTDFKPVGDKKPARSSSKSSSK